MDEFQLIQHYFRGHHQQQDVRLGSGDDAALLAPATDRELAMSMDTLVSGTHFPADLSAHAIGYRSLAVNLSDLAAMGAEPAWCLLSLSLPELDEAWLEGFSSGFFSLADRVGISLVGGDIVRGPLAITLQVTGQLPFDTALTRSGARPGERLVVGGVPGEAAVGLAQWQAGKRDGYLVERFCYPKPQLSLGVALRGMATSCIDISDGLVADLGHLLESSGGLGAEVVLKDIPPIPSMETVDTSSMLDSQLSGGDDYLLLFTQPAGLPLPEACHAIGTITRDKGIKLRDGSGNCYLQTNKGWRHF